MSDGAIQSARIRRLEQYPRDAAAAMELADGYLRDGNSRAAVLALAECIAARGDSRISPNLCLKLGLLSLAEVLKEPELGAYLLDHLDEDLRSRLTVLIQLVGAALAEALPSDDIPLELT